MSMSTVEVQSGYLPVTGGWLWYEAHGVQHQKTPLLILHGGPGAGHRYLTPLKHVAQERMVVFYDQLGCGRSEEPANPELWNMERFVEELKIVRQMLGLKHIHLLGHSWGGWLAIEYMLSQPQGVKSLILASTSASLLEYAAGVERLRKDLPPELYQRMAEHESSGDLQNLDYKEAVLMFYRRHLCRLDPWPQLLIDNVRDLSENAVYETMQGPNEFLITGNLKNWDRRERIHEITCPTLITAGRYDEFTSACTATLHQGIQNSQVHIFEQSAHMAHIEEPDLFLRVLKKFLATVDGLTDLAN